MIRVKKLFAKGAQWLVDKKNAFNDAVIAAYAMLVSALPALATDGAAGTAIETGIKSGARQIYGIVTAIVLPIGAVALAICGFKILWGNQKAAEEAKGFAVRLVIAMAIVFGAGLIINEVGGWFSSMGDGGVFG